MLRSARFGELMRVAALDTARAYLPAHAPMSWQRYLRRGARAALEWRSQV
jgi:hypothetical protein